MKIYQQYRYIKVIGSRSAWTELKYKRQAVGTSLLRLPCSEIPDLWSAEFLPIIFNTVAAHLHRSDVAVFRMFTFNPNTTKLVELTTHLYWHVPTTMYIHSSTKRSDSERTIQPPPPPPRGGGSPHPAARVAGPLNGSELVRSWCGPRWAAASESARVCSRLLWSWCSCGCPDWGPERLVAPGWRAERLVAPGGRIAVNRERTKMSI